MTLVGLLPQAFASCLVMGLGPSSSQRESFCAARALQRNGCVGFRICIHITITCLSTPLNRQACCLSQRRLNKLSDSQ